MSERGKIVVAVSGGVDSATAAYRLKRDGWDVVTAFMHGEVALDPPGGCGGAYRPVADPTAARRVAEWLGVELRELDFTDAFDRLITGVCEAYGAGRTPNPCVLCNRDIKFGRLLAFAEEVGADAFATGHYARVDRSGRRPRLLAGEDPDKDQSYFLFTLTPEVLARVRLPLGGARKADVVADGRKLGVPVRPGKSSQDICFVEGRLGQFVARRRPDLVRPGPIVDTDGRELGRHDGVVHFTIGQRRGLGVAVGEPRYVVAIRPESATVVVGPRAALARRRLVAERMVWHAERPPEEAFRGVVRIRYRHRPRRARVEPLADGRAEVTFDDPVVGPTPGQAAVVYDGEAVVGGGWIAETYAE